MMKKVMVIDDEPDILLYLSAAVQDAGYEACTAGAGSVTEEVGRERPDLIILDIMMPKRSGMAVYRALRGEESTKGIPVIVVSGLTSAREFEADGFRKLVPDEAVPPPEAFLEKPVKVDVLCRILTRLLGPGEDTAR